MSFPGQTPIERLAAALGSYEAALDASSQGPGSDRFLRLIEDMRRTCDLVGRAQAALEAATDARLKANKRARLATEQLESNVQEMQKISKERVQERALLDKATSQLQEAEQRVLLLQDSNAQLEHQLSSIRQDLGPSSTAQSESHGWGRGLLSTMWNSQREQQETRAAETQQRLWQSYLERVEAAATLDRECRQEKTENARLREELAKCHNELQVRSESVRLGAEEAQARTRSAETQAAGPSNDSTTRLSPEQRLLFLVSPSAQHLALMVVLEGLVRASQSIEAAHQSSPGLMAAVAPVLHALLLRRLATDSKDSLFAFMDSDAPITLPRSLEAWLSETSAYISSPAAASHSPLDGLKLPARLLDHFGADRSHFDDLITGIKLTQPRHDLLKHHSWPKSAFRAPQQRLPPMPRLSLRRLDPDQARSCVNFLLWALLTTGPLLPCPSSAARADPSEAITSLAVSAFGPATPRDRARLLLWEAPLPDDALDHSNSSLLVGLVPLIPPASDENDTVPLVAGHQYVVAPFVVCPLRRQVTVVATLPAELQEIDHGRLLVKARIILFGSASATDGRGREWRVAIGEAQAEEELAGADADGDVGMDEARRVPSPCLQLLAWLAGTSAELLRECRQRRWL